jgi:hypothetical protein
VYQVSSNRSATFPSHLEGKITLLTPLRASRLEGHPPLNAFLGVPLFDQGFSNMIGMIGIANKAGGYSKDDIDFIEPFVVTCSNLIQAYNTRKENKRLINTLEEKVSERTLELSLANERLEAANKRVVAASAAQLTHFACMSHEIRYVLCALLQLFARIVELILTIVYGPKDALKLHNRLEQSTSGDGLVRQTEGSHLNDHNEW